ncbi:leucine zipper domain-containing protein [Streptomyces sp. NPDC006476]|uniref:helix-turn-helix domain-containing protein n=1 Tax=Streptomyces sp. NPDC006476 TaxID=3157175 RepID=UPI00339E48D3
MPHRSAPLTETGRLRLARCVVEDGWPLRRVAERFQVSQTTAQRWADRYRQYGEAGMADRSSRPCSSPRRTPTRAERRIIRFNRTLLDEWAYAHPYRSETERRDAFPDWLHTYNHHRGHTALKGQPPASRGRL